MFAKIVRMPPPGRITDEDLEIEASCRRLASRYRRKGAIEDAARWERVAERIKRARGAR
jgi:hypothetical protein